MCFLAFFCAACTLYCGPDTSAGACDEHLGTVPKYAGKHTAINVVLIYSYIIALLLVLIVFLGAGVCSQLNRFAQH